MIATQKDRKLYPMSDNQISVNQKEFIAVNDDHNEFDIVSKKIWDCMLKLN